MITDKEIKGNTCIYFLFQICNVALSVLGLFTIAISIYLIALSKCLNIFNSLFFIFGIILIILSYFGCKLRNSPNGNLIYSIILTFIFICDLIVTIILLFFREILTDWIIQNYDTEEQTLSNATKIVNRNIKTVNDLLLLIVMLFVKRLLI
jgi:hypothetical protein